MSKYERFIIYPLLIVTLIFALIGNPVLLANQENEDKKPIKLSEIEIPAIKRKTQVFDRIEAKEIVIKNSDGVEVVVIKDHPFMGGVIETYTDEGTKSISMASESFALSRILVRDKVLNYQTSGSGGRIETYNEDGEMVNLITSNSNGSGMIKTFNKEGMIGTSMESNSESNIINCEPGGMIGTYNKEGDMVSIIATDTEGGGVVETYRDLSACRVIIGQTEKGHGGIWVYDRYGEYPAFYGHSR